jgi:hypothetical protein
VDWIFLLEGEIADVDNKGLSWLGIGPSLIVKGGFENTQSDSLHFFWELILVWVIWLKSGLLMFFIIIT